MNHFGYIATTGGYRGRENESGWPDNNFVTFDLKFSRYQVTDILTVHLKFSNWYIKYDYNMNLGPSFTIMVRLSDLIGNCY